MIKVGIAGASGYTGVELIKLISNHPQARLETITSSSYKGKPLTDIFPSMRGFESLICEELDAKALSTRVDLMFLALPHKVSMAYAKPLIEQGIKVIDLSADFRFSNRASYEKTYQTHTAKDLLEESVYGLSEIYRDKIKGARIIGNPGCYPTTILLALLPLIKEQILDTKQIIADSKSGVSGAGRSLSLATHYCEANESITPYKIGNHRHTPEIEEILSIHAEKKVSVTFVPHLVPVTRGMISTIYGHVNKSVHLTDIYQAYQKYYAKEPFVRLLPNGCFPSMSHVRGTNCCDIGCHFDENTGRIILISAIDNLLKGAAGQAVQNMNIMFGLADETGLNYVQTPL
ncbi:MAG: N-acetyl-gamma-glutamyl-phosphate reductase [Desulfobacteraceae bacterium]|nr:N-acetyl-gamma-glutamyl-phosphate reductase [Desulfobacteraceae bacterium]